MGVGKIKFGAGKSKKVCERARLSACPIEHGGERQKEGARGAAHRLLCERESGLDGCGLRREEMGGAEVIAED
jgi:hypothetical protein